MYVKTSVGGFLVLTGIAAPVAATPAMRAARLLLEVTGVGFGIYCAAASGLLVTGATMRLRHRLASTGPPGAHRHRLAGERSTSPFPLPQAPEEQYFSERQNTHTEGWTPLDGQGPAHTHNEHRTPETAPPGASGSPVGQEPDQYEHRTPHRERPEAWGPFDGQEYGRSADRSETWGSFGGQGAGRRPAEWRPGVWLGGE